MSDFLGNLISSAYGASDAIQPRLGAIFGNSPVTFAEGTFEFEKAAPLEESTLAAGHLPPRELNYTNRTGDEQAHKRGAFLMPETVSQQINLASNFDRPFSYASRSEKSEIKFSGDTPEVAEENAAAPVTAESPLFQFRPGEISLQKNDFTALPKSETATSPGQRSARPAKIFSPLQSKTGFSSQPVAPPERKNSLAKENFAAGQLDAVADSASTAIAAMRSAPVFPQTSLRPYTQSLAPPQNGKTVSPSAPIIRVNIGRIEVRAVTPAAPPAHPKRPRAGPMLSLEDYLKQRGGQR